MINNNMFGQINVLYKAMDATLLKQETINNNIANINTPGYKKQTVQFETYLSAELNRTNNKASKVDLESINGKVILENPNYSMRMDENNVDVEVEIAEKSKNSLRYSTLVESVTNDFERFNTALNAIK